MGRLLRKIDWYFNSKILRRRYIKRTIKHVTMYLDTQTKGISKALGVNGTREEDMILLIKQYLKKGGTVIDCGSNIGFYPLLESQIVGAGGTIVSIEPDPRNYELLQRNLELIPKDVRVFKFNIAISSQPGEMSLFVGCASNLNKIVRDLEPVEQGETIKVQVDTIDSLIAKLGVSPDFLRMDIEGHEVEVIKGMQKTLLDAAPGFVLLFELHPDEYSEKNSLEEVLRPLQDMGFRCEAMVSAGFPNHKLYTDMGYQPAQVIQSDGRERGLYPNVKFEDAIKLAVAVPKASRYIMLIKG